MLKANFWVYLEWTGLNVVWRVGAIGRATCITTNAIVTILISWIIASKEGMAENSKRSSDTDVLLIYLIDWVLIPLTPFFWDHTKGPLDSTGSYLMLNSMKKPILRSKISKNGLLPSHQRSEGAPIEHKNLQISVSQVYIFSLSIQHL